MLTRAGEPAMVHDVCRATATDVHCIRGITLSISLQLLLRNKLEDAPRIGHQRLHDCCGTLQRGLLPAGRRHKRCGPGRVPPSQQYSGMSGCRTGCYSPGRAPSTACRLRSSAKAASMHRRDESRQMLLHGALGTSRSRHNGGMHPACQQHSIAPPPAPQQQQQVAYSQAYPSCELGSGGVAYWRP